MVVELSDLSPCSNSTSVLASVTDRRSRGSVTQEGLVPLNFTTWIGCYHNRLHQWSVT